MNRRHFLKTAGAAAALASISRMAPAETQEFPAEIIQKIRDRIRPITAGERALRIARAQQLMAEQNLQALLVEGGTTLKYFTGVDWWRSERLFAMILPVKGDPFFVSPKFEEGRAKEQTGNAAIYTWEENESPYELIRKALSERSLLTASLGIEETTRYFVTEGVQQTVPSLTLRNATPVTAGCRAVKSDHEIELIQVANDITAHVYKAAVKRLKAGMGEQELGDLITKLFAEFKVEGGALVLFGESSAYPHGLVKESKLQENDIVLIDGGCTVEGYDSDVTRTTIFGKPSQKMIDVWSIVREAQEQALKTAAPGVPAEQVDAAARKVITDRGYGDGFKYFTHRVGHGIGMDGHEWYYLVGGNKRPLEPGNIFSDEPGIYIPGEFGIRLEDELLITPKGAKLLLPQAKSLTEIF